MQIKSLRIKSYRSFKVDDTTPADALGRLRRIETYRALRAEGCTEATALRATGWSRSCYFRWLKRYQSQGVRGLAAQSRRPHRTQHPHWTRQAEREVWAMRTKYPFMGKRRLRVMLAREGLQFSESTLGRILAKGVRLGRIRPCAFCRGRTQVKRRRHFNGHAQRWRYGQTAHTARRVGAARPPVLLPRQQTAQGVQGHLPRRQATRGQSLLPRHRTQRQTLP